jgi:transposase
VDAPSAYGPRKTLHNRFVRWAAKGVWRAVFEALAAAGGPPAEAPLDSTHVKAHRCAAGGKGGGAPRRSAPAGGGRATKLHALGDGLGRPPAFLLTPGQAADRRAAEALPRDLPPDARVVADRAYDTDAVRGRIQAL